MKIRLATVALALVLAGCAQTPSQLADLAHYLSHFR